MSYQTLLHELAPDLNPAGIEASMRLHYGTLNHYASLLRQITDSAFSEGEHAK